MNTGDLVRVKDGDHRIQKEGPFPLGVITDVIEGDDGFCHFEVAYFFMECQESEWFSDLHLELISESR
jgi:hypothetical protein